MKNILSKISVLYLASLLISHINYLVINTYRKYSYERLLIDLVEYARTVKLNTGFDLENFNKILTSMDLLGSAHSTVFSLLFFFLTMVSLINKRFVTICFSINLLVSVCLLICFGFIIHTCTTIIHNKDIFLSFF